MKSLPHTALYLHCRGYLQDIIFCRINNDEQMIAQVQLITAVDTENRAQEVVYLNLEIKDKNDQADFQYLLPFVQASKEVVLTLRAKYSAFEQAYAGYPELGDPRSMITFQATLVELIASEVAGEIMLDKCNPCSYRVHSPCFNHLSSLNYH